MCLGLFPVVVDLNADLALIAVEGQRLSDLLLSPVVPSLIHKAPNLHCR